jgi:flagellar biosynthesis chaperone FliJ
MSTREARIEKLVQLRDRRLKLAVRALEELRLLERRAHNELNVAQSSQKNAERERRELSHTGTDIRRFIEAEEWLRARTIEEEMCALRLRQARAQLDKGQQRVKDAAIKLRQLELLQERLKCTRLAKESRAERVLEDEIGQRVAHSERTRKGEP